MVGFAYRDLVRQHLHLSSLRFLCLDHASQVLAGHYDEVFRRRIRRHAMPLALQGGAPKILGKLSADPGCARGSAVGNKTAAPSQ